jgi:phosphoribosylamine--glycine ligase
VELCQKALAGGLAEAELLWDDRVALGVVMAAGGYPLGYDKGDVISGLAEMTDQDVKTFHAGTTVVDGEVVTNGGRVLCVVGLGDTVAAAQAKAYAGVAQIDWRDCYYRRDIGYRAISRRS